MNNSERELCIGQLDRAIYELKQAQSPTIAKQHRKERENGAAVCIRDVLITMDESIPTSVILMVKILENLDPESFPDLPHERIKRALYAAKCEFGI